MTSGPGVDRHDTLLPCAGKRRRRWRLGLAALLLCTLPPLAAAPLDVFVSVLPLATFAERVGGERVQVHTMVQPGHSPATYEPTPRQITALANADLYLRVGVPFEDAWMKRIRATNPDMPVVDLREGLSLRRQEAHRHGAAGGDDHGAQAHEHGPLDAHVWTSPRLVRQMAETMRAAFTELDPAGAVTYAEQQAAFDAELAALDAQLQARLHGLANRRFLVYHPAWGYFADAYGLTQIPIEQEGKEPGARRLTALIEQARAEGARVILVQPQFDQRAAAQVARAIDGRVEPVDPLSPEYAATLRRLADILMAADAGTAAGAPKAAHREQAPREQAPREQTP
ncbi:zinc ABC transporter substrate-binding protein [uncultured Thiohalocapsa sp.]|uniref:metal ABC transporter solute-binding protein, Zn/Mn family n=1 Tax=uncultured Thiohalocapsa sp. TaxID=768990 RepID=UPI0025F0CE98|nr:zinc ABC transporter substrate-binding protein [uncultured Thiohalocapsa sp.]